MADEEFELIAHPEEAGEYEEIIFHACPNVHRGCTVRLFPFYYKDHIERCQYGLVDCGKCGKQILRSETCHGFDKDVQTVMESADVALLEQLVFKLQNEINHLKLSSGSKSNSATNTECNDTSTGTQWEEMCPHDRPVSSVPQCCLFDTKFIRWGSYVPLALTQHTYAFVPAERVRLQVGNILVEAYPYETVWQLKKKAGISSDIVLLLNGTVMRDEKMLKEYPIQDGAVLRAAVLSKSTPCFVGR